MVWSKVHHNQWTKPIVLFGVLQNPLKNQTEPNLTIPMRDLQDIHSIWVTGLFHILIKQKGCGCSAANRQNGGVDGGTRPFIGPIRPYKNLLWQVSDIDVDLWPATTARLVLITPGLVWGSEPSWAHCVRATEFVVRGWSTRDNSSFGFVSQPHMPHGILINYHTT